MPDIKISQLPDATTSLAGTELAVVVKSGVDKHPFVAQPDMRCVARSMA